MKTSVEIRRPQSEIRNSISGLKSQNFHVETPNRISCRKAPWGISDSGFAILDLEELPVPEAGEVAQWDFITVVAWWNLYVLPTLLALVLGALVIHRRLRPANIAGLDGVRTIQRIALIHFVLGLRALIHLTQEMGTWRTMGIPQSNPVSIVITVLSVLINPLLGIGLWRLRPGARPWAIVWYILWSLIAAGVTYWIWRYHAVVEPADWPDHLVGKALPWFLLGMMLLPQTRRVFSDRPALDACSLAGETPSKPAARPPQRDWPILTRLVVVLLIVACSTLVVDAADWIDRMVAESDMPSPEV
jgi:hypothetical protein